MGLPELALTEHLDSVAGAAGLLRLVEEPLRHVVLDEHLRQQDEEQDLPGPANSRTLTANTLLFRDRRALPEWTLIPALFFGPSEAPPHVVDNLTPRNSPR